MNDIVNLTIQVSKELANKLLKNDKIEVMIRRANARIDAIKKCPIILDGAQSDTVARKVFEATKKASENESQIISKMNRFFKIAGKSIIQTNAKMNALSAEMRSVASKIDKYANSLDSIHDLSYLTVGLELANLSVEVAGIVYISQRLNRVEKKIEELSEQVNQIKMMLTNERLSVFQKICLRFGAISTRLKDGETINRKEIEDLLIDMRTFMSELIRNFSCEAMDVDMLLDMIFHLLTAYTAILNVFLKDYYFEKGQLPSNLESYSSLFKELLDPAFNKKVGDYLILKKGLNITEMVNAIHVQEMLVMNCMLQYEDQIDLVSIAETRENYLTLTKIANQFAKETIEEAVDTTVQGPEADRCKRLFEKAFQSVAVAGA